MKKYFLALSLLIFSIYINAQTTDKFEQNILFDKDNYKFTRTIYFNVPTDYDKNKSYQLTVGFRDDLPTNAGQFGEQLSFLTGIPDAIKKALEVKQN